MRISMKRKVEQETLAYITGITYATASNWFDASYRDMKLDIIMPKNRAGHEKQPLVVWFCGGSFREVDRAVWMPEMMYFARRGYTVASVEYRVSSQAKFPEPLIDAKAAIRFLKAHADLFCIDPDRVAVMGESAGGTMASLVGVTAHMSEFDRGDFLDYDSSVNAVIDFYGLVDFDEAELTGTPIDAAPPWTITDFVGVTADRDAEKKASAVNYVTKDTCPVMILHGSEDPLVTIKMSETFYNKLQAAGVRSDFLVIDGAYHGDDAFYQDEVLDEVDSFIRGVFMN